MAVWETPNRISLSRGDRLRLATSKGKPSAHLLQQNAPNSRIAFFSILGLSPDIIL